MNPVELERRLQRIERQLDELASAGRPRVRSGTWTPEVYGTTIYGTTTYGLQEGRYVLINRICICWIAVFWSATTASGELRVTLPIASDANLYYPVLASRCSFFAYSNDATLSPEIVPNTTYLRIVESTSGGQSAIINIPSSGYLSLAGAYLIAP